MQEIKILSLTSIREALGERNVRSGAETEYYQVDDHFGIKVYRYAFAVGGYGGGVSPQEVTISSLYKEIQRQMSIMNRLAVKRRAPKVYEIVLIKTDRTYHGLLNPDRYYPAIVVEHIDYEVKSFSKRWVHVNRFVKGLRRLYATDDNHSGNIVYSNKYKKFMMIDFGQVYYKFSQWSLKDLHSRMKSRWTLKSQMLLFNNMSFQQYTLDIKKKL